MNVIYPWSHPRPGSRLTRHTIVKQDVQPEDLHFCLRATWADLGQKYYYACRHWDLGPDSGSRQVGQDIRSHAQLDTRYKSSGPGKIPPAAVSFDPNGILALDEYRSISPLLHVDE